MAGVDKYVEFYINMSGTRTIDDRSLGQIKNALDASMEKTVVRAREQRSIADDVGFGRFTTEILWSVQE